MIALDLKELTHHCDREDIFLVLQEVMRDMGVGSEYTMIDQNQISKEGMLAIEKRLGFTVYYNGDLSRYEIKIT